MFAFPTKKCLGQHFHAWESRQREPMAMVDDGEPSGDTPSFETQKTDSGKNLMDAVEISFICSFLL